MRRSLLSCRWLVLAVVPLAAASCSADTDSTAPEPAADPGALVEVELASQVGVLLDELPAAERDRAATALLAAPEAMWTARAARQVELTLYRLVFRNFYYDGKGQLPLPPREKWRIALDAAGAERTTVGGHDLVAIRYTLTSTLLSDAGSPAEAEPALASVGGFWDEPFVLPIDPELLLQRTGYACMDESEFPPNSVDAENVSTFYDHECEAGENDCHLTEIPSEGCVEALDAHVGKVETSVRFTRVAWDAAKAEEARVGEVTNPTGADLAVIAGGLENHRVIYRYVPPDSCAIAEGCVGGPGWRRLLQFDASVKNLGAAALDIGDVDYYLEGAGTSLGDHNIYEFSECHQHYHFSHYGDFTYGDGPQTGQKRAFCLQSTSRYSNNEASPLTNPYGSCAYQGIQAGWGDDYGAGLDCQWIDVTDVDTAGGAVTRPLAFVSNPDQFLCEGTPVLDADGHPTFEPTDFTTKDGKPVDRPVCDFMAGWDANNTGSLEVMLPVDGGLTTAACDRGQLGPLRDCGFQEQKDAGSQITCTPGQPLTLDCTVADPLKPQVLRACERSAVLGTGVACTYRDALANEVVATGTTTITLGCPAARDASEPGGLVALYAAPLLPEDAAQAVACTVVP